MQTMFFMFRYNYSSRVSTINKGLFTYLHIVQYLG